MKNITKLELPEEMYSVRILVAIGLYKTKSEVMKNSIRRLQSGSIKSALEIRKILDRVIGEEELSSVIKRMREEETH